MLLQETKRAVVEEFRARRISIPFPQREIRVLNEVPAETRKLSLEDSF
jgi:small-conductance mechanosensitive channel